MWHALLSEYHREASARGGGDKYVHAKSPYMDPATGDFAEGIQDAASVDGRAVKVIQPGEHVDPEEIKRNYYPTPDEVKGKIEAAARLAEAEREQCTTTERRVEVATKYKNDGNTQLAEGNTGQALQCYLTGIWILKSSDPPYSDWLGSPKPPSGAEVIGLLCSCSVADLASISGVEEDATASPMTSAICVALHLNAAAACLKRSDYEAARAACEYVLAVQPASSKGLFRLAKAQEGAGELASAAWTLRRLLGHEPKNADARSFFAALSARMAAEKQAYGGLFERGLLGDEEGTAAAPPPPTVEEQMAAKQAELEAKIANMSEREARSCVEDEVKAAEVAEARRRAKAEAKAEAMIMIAPEARERLQRMRDGGASVMDYRRAYEMARIEEQHRVKSGMTRDECDRMQRLVRSDAPEKEKRRVWLQIRDSVDSRARPDLG